MINFVSQLPKDLRTGGFSAMNAAACAALESRHAVRYVGPIDPPVILRQKAISKALRLAGLGGDYFTYSEQRLRAIAREAGERTRGEASLDFYHGLTPWCLTRPRRAYVAWSDCAFCDYIEIFHDRTRFRADDLARIEAAEAAWLKGARRVIFTSDWAAERAVRRYGLDPARIGNVGIFGELEAPERDAFAGGATFAFVSTNFAAKGGPVVLEAFRALRQDHPEAQLIVVGSPPGEAVADGVEYAGFLRKETPAELARFREILGGARAVVHPTRSDIAPLLLVEAALFGCPVIASRAFAIPELVQHQKSGLLLDAPGDPAAVAGAMAWMLETPEPYEAMRAEAWRRVRALNTKARFEARLNACVDEAIAETSAAAA